MTEMQAYCKLSTVIFERHICVLQPDPQYKRGSRQGLQILCSHRFCAHTLHVHSQRFSYLPTTNNPLLTCFPFPSHSLEPCSLPKTSKPCPAWR